MAGAVWVAPSTALALLDRAQKAEAALRAAQEAPAPEGLRKRLHDLSHRAVEVGERPTIDGWQDLFNDAIGLGYEVLDAQEGAE
jgi:hypothetical protein